MLSLKNICVKYSYKTVLSGVSLNFEAGKIYALLGENGAGKSTLSKVICGDIQPTGGEVVLGGSAGGVAPGVGGELVQFTSPHDAIARGIVCVHQRPLLAPSISIHENLLLGQKKVKYDDEERLLAEWLPSRKLSDLVKNISLEETFFVSLTQALLRNPSFLILDEPPFIPTEKLRALADGGRTILVITHNLAQAMAQSDRIILLQEGTVLEEKAAADYTEDEIKQKLFGISKEVALPDFIEKEDVTEDEVMGMHAASRMRAAADGAVGYIPSDKNFRASNPRLTILQLATAYHQNLGRAEREAFAREILLKADVDIHLEEKAECLSGGMLQRVILEREIAENPSKLYLFNPTKGLDVEGTERFYAKLESLAKKGTKIIMGMV